MKYVWAILPGLALVLALGPPAASAQENNYIAVTGSGEAQQWPDYAVVTASVQATEKTTKEAISRTTETLRALAGDLKKMGIPDDRIEFLPPSVERKKERVQQKDGEYREVLVGFEAWQSISVTLDDVGRVGEVITVLTNKNVRISGGVTFELKDAAELEARARALAIADARRKAQDYAKGSGRRLGKLLVVEESGIAQFRLRPTLREEITGIGEGRSMRGGSASMPTVPLTPQPVVSRVTLYVKYALE